MSSQVGFNTRHSKLDRLIQSQEDGAWGVDFDGILKERFDLYKLTTFAPNKRLPIHSWYSYLQGFSAQLVELLLNHFQATQRHTVLDPWCGVGTTNIVCAQKGVFSFGVDISPLATFITQTKLNGVPNISELNKVIDRLRRRLKTATLPNTLSQFKCINQCIPENTLKQLNFLKTAIRQIRRKPLRDFFFLALLVTLEQLSTLKKDGAHYKLLSEPTQTNVWFVFEETVRHFIMHDDLFNNTPATNPEDANIKIGDSRLLHGIHDASINFVITSPPYLNRDNYIAQNKLELMFGDFVEDFSEYRKLTHSTLRSHVEARSNNFVSDLNIPHLTTCLERLRERRGILNNKDVLPMTEGYFIDMHLSLQAIYRVLERRGKVALVVGNSCWGGVLFEVDKLLVEIARNVGFRHNAIWVTRYKLNSAQQITRFGKKMVRESIVLLEKP